MRTLVIILTCLFVIPCQARTITVDDDGPADHGTIQAAIDDANDGDVITVADGNYTGAGNKDIDFGGLAITVRSAHGPEFATIDCERSGRGFYFHSGEGNDSVLDGFTVTNGYVGTSNPGGGIYCVESSPHIINCILRDNQAKDGAGMKSARAEPLVENCFFLNNFAYDGGGDGDGGGLLCTHSSSEIKNCLFVNNEAYGQGSGGGLRIFGHGSEATVTNCTFVANKAGYGGGLEARYALMLCENCIFWGNEGRGAFGVEMQSRSGGTVITLTHCDIRRGWNGPYVDRMSGGQVVNGGGNIDAGPLFVSGPSGDYYLSQIPAGQASDSPCVDTGSDFAENFELDAFTTRTDSFGDSGMVDMGFHYRSWGLSIPVGFDIKPGSCPNPLNLSSKGVLPTAILGSEDFDVNSIDVATVRLEGVAPIRSHLEDVAMPVPDGNECECLTDGPDGYTDLVLHFKNREVVAGLNADAELLGGDELALAVTAELSDGTPIDGIACVVIAGKVPKALAAKRSDVNEDGIVNISDFAELAENWLEAAVTAY
jgi:hypothetical protein